MAECFWPGVTGMQVIEAGHRARRAIRDVESATVAACYLGSILVPNDEIALYLFEANSLDVVSDTGRRAAIPCERVVEIVQLGAGSHVAPFPTHTRKAAQLSGHRSRSTAISTSRPTRRRVGPASSAHRHRWSANTPPRVAASSSGCPSSRTSHTCGAISSRNTQRLGRTTMNRTRSYALAQAGKCPRRHCTRGAPAVGSFNSGCRRSRRSVPSEGVRHLHGPALELRRPHRQSVRRLQRQGRALPTRAHLGAAVGEAETARSSQPSHRADRLGLHCPDDRTRLRVLRAAR